MGGGGAAPAGCDAGGIGGGIGAAADGGTGACGGAIDGAMCGIGGGADVTLAGFWMRPLPDASAAKGRCSGAPTGAGGGGGIPLRPSGTVVDAAGCIGICGGAGGGIDAGDIVGGGITGAIGDGEGGCPGPTPFAPEPFGRPPRGAVCGKLLPGIGGSIPGAAFGCGAGGGVDGRAPLVRGEGSGGAAPGRAAASAGVAAPPSRAAT